MKTITSYLHSLLFTLVALCLASGCSTTSSGAYKLKQTRMDVDWAMARYQNRVPSGFITPQEQQRVNTAYKAYQAAFEEAVKQAGSDYDAPTPANVKQLANQLLGILDSL